jgi:hypothetical protein
MDFAKDKPLGQADTVAKKPDTVRPKVVHS